jgi:site-specific recombinase XerD
MNQQDYYQQINHDFSQWLYRLGYAKSTIEGHHRRLNHFFLHLKNQHIEQLAVVNPLIITSYENHLDKLPIGSKTMSHYMSTLRIFNQYLESYGQEPILKNKLRVIPHQEAGKVILTQAEVKLLYRATDNSAPGYRDRAMLALYYGCGLRAREGLQLAIKDLDFNHGLVQIGKTKTYRPRYVPMSEQVKNHLQEWLEHGREMILKTDSEIVLVHGRGQYQEATGFNARLKKLQEQAGIDKQVTLHGLRHSIATHLLENGMPLEQIKQFLGHHSLEVTQRYTHILHEGRDI